jgi:hypothetical protein
MDMREIKPSLDTAQDVRDGQRPCHDPPAGGDADKREEDGPREPDPFCSGEAFIPPPAGAFVYR